MRLKNRPSKTKCGESASDERRLDNLVPRRTLPDALLGRVYTPALAIFKPQVREISTIWPMQMAMKRWRPHQDHQNARGLRQLLVRVCVTSSARLCAGEMSAV